MESTTSLPIKLQPSNLRPFAFRILSKKHGLNINTDALAVLTETISFKFGFDWKGPRTHQFLEDIAKIWKVEDRGLFIDGAGLKQIIKNMNQKSETSSFSDKATRSDTIVDVGEDALNWDDYFKFITPEDQPRSIFDKSRKQFNISTKKKGSLFQSLSENLSLSIDTFNNRYHLLSDRLSRNENFQKSSTVSISSLSMSLKDGNLANEITLIKNVLGRDGQKFILFGLLSKNANDQYILEDSTDNIELNLSQTHKTEGSFYCTGMFVIVEGIYSASGGSSNQAHDYIGGCFYVSTIGQPPAERREKSLDAYGNVDFLGIHKQAAVSGEKITKITKTLKRKLTTLERSLIDHKFIFVGSDCFLDSFKVLDGLKKFFQRLENSIIESIESDEKSTPLALVLTGSFSSQPLHTTSSSTTAISQSETYKSNFDSLTNLLGNYPNIVQTCKLVLIPGKNDPWQSGYSLGASSMNYFPQRSIPNAFVNRLEELLPRGNLILGWNPMRINYLSQEIVIIKDEYMNKCKRNDIVFTSDLESEQERTRRDSAIYEERIESIVQGGNRTEILSSKIKHARKLVKTLLDQGNLQPYTKDLKLINPQYAHALRIEPLPTVLILHDAGFDNFEVTYNGCKVVNIGQAVSENNRKLNYAEYHPSSKKFEFKDLHF
ncbi:DNA-directed DNA polymerase epsilon, subunit B [Spathaspora passalidarum NRRL Y-27907]|uniref:DNA polymerase epsilon subunit B n=1 Tax=Spathaspora passalidarum (strain NRRL Y-27907 / 11-Y1) TaxID=619300 RepID=G3AIV8_SPAPN|nr:DNA-directed DNA polymerase epsilon, subunit B [Spathaspora passalidarum NRRL Y-27907]EGW33769.1 DNA-directed DNA polymerase epsilon, subunit B [Spathaspora passalidarum NRRL Y-27907]